MRVIKLAGVIISVRAGVFMAPGHNEGNKTDRWCNYGRASPK